MRYLLVACLLLAACDGPQFSCIDGVKYLRRNDMWEMVDAAPAHKGITPTPCKPSNPEGGK